MQLEANTEYEDLDRRVRELRTSLDETMGNLDDHDAFLGFVRDLERDERDDPGGESPPGGEDDRRE